MIKENSVNYSVRLMCKILCVSPSGYYDWRDRLSSKREQENAILAAKIKLFLMKSMRVQVQNALQSDYILKEQR